MPKIVSAQENMSDANWLEDLDHLKGLISTEHVRPFWQSNESDFEKLFESVRNDFSQKTLSKQEKVIAFMQLVAFIRDGHTAISSGDRYRLLGYLPFTAAWFGNDLHIIRTTASLKPALGSKILAINGVTIQEVCEKLRRIVPHANESRFKKFSPNYLHLPGALFGLGITASPNKAMLLLEDEHGARFHVEYTNMSPEVEEKTQFLDFLDDIDALPLYQTNADEAYWFDYIEEEGILYFKYNRVTSMKAENVWAFAARLFNFIDQNQIDKFIVDIRDNGGGSSAFSAPFWHGIATNGKINQRGKLFVITGYKTFSAAINFASQLERNTKAIFVGEPPCDYLHSPGDNDEFKLPNSGTTVLLSKIFHEESFHKDHRSALVPELPINLTFNEYASGIDQAFEKIKNYEDDQKIKQLKNPSRYIGRYSFSPETNLNIKKGDYGLEMTITGKFTSPLYPSKKRSFKTEIPGFELWFDKSSNLFVYYPDGQVRRLQRTTSDDVTPSELIYQSKLNQAEEKLKALKKEFPDQTFWKDHALVDLALELYYDFSKEKGREQAKAMARSVIEMAIRINPEDNAYARSALEYY
ncbi:MAG: hypothetical protein AAF502_16580 [Bacteroidota bacterium]